MSSRFIFPAFFVVFFTQACATGGGRKIASVLGQRPESLQSTQNDFKPVNCKLNLEDFVVLRTLECLRDHHQDGANQEQVNTCLGRHQNRKSTSPVSAMRSAVELRGKIAAAIQSEQSGVDGLFRRLTSSPRVQACTIEQVTEWDMPVDKKVPFLSWSHFDDSLPASQVFKSAAELSKFRWDSSRVYDFQMLVRPKMEYDISKSVGPVPGNEGAIKVALIKTARWSRQRASSLIPSEEKEYATFTDEVFDSMFADELLSEPGVMSSVRARLDLGQTAYDRELIGRLNRCIGGNTFLEVKSAGFVANRLSTTCGGEKPATIFRPMGRIDVSPQLFDEIPKSEQMTGDGSLVANNFAIDFDVLDAEYFAANGISWRPLWVYKNYAYDFDNEKLEAAFGDRQGAIEALKNFSKSFGNESEDRPLDADPIEPSPAETKAKARRDRALMQSGQMVKLMASLKGIFVMDLAANRKRVEVVSMKAIEIPREVACAYAIGTGIYLAANGREQSSKATFSSFIANSKKQIGMIPKAQCSAEAAKALIALDTTLKAGMTLVDLMEKTGGKRINDGPLE